MLEYQGPFSYPLLIELAKTLKQKEDTENQNFKRLYRVFMELCENLIKHSTTEICLDGHLGCPTGKVSITQNGTSYLLITENKISENEMTILQKRCELVRNTSRKNLKEYRRSLIQEDVKGENGNIGLVTIALHSNGNIDYKFIKLKESLLFRLTVRIE